MTPSARSLPARFAAVVFRLTAPVALLALAAPFAFAAAPDARKDFNVPAGEAVTTLKQFSAQAGRPVIFPEAAVAGETTRAVSGSLAPGEALARMLDGTQLTFVRDEPTGSFAIRIAANPPKKDPARADSTPTTRAATAPGRPATEDVIELAAFTVTAADERGYLAGNAISGTKTKTALRDLPISISVLTSDLIEDLAGALPSEALNYSSSVDLTNAGSIGNVQGTPFNTGTTTVRGSGTFFSMRDGFRSYGEPSSITVQRIEVVKGPAAVLYGITKPGGIVNYITRTPQFGKNSARITASYGSYASTRSTLDVNYGRLLGDKLAVRLGASYNDLATWFRFSKGTELSIAPSVAWKPFAGTEILVQYEHTERRFPSNSTDYLTRPVAGFRGSSVPFFIYPSGPADPVAALTPQLPAGFTPDFTFRGYGSTTRVPYKTFTASVTQRLGEHLTANLQVSRSRRNNIREIFAPTPQFTGAIADPAAANTPTALPRFRKQYEFRDGYNELDNVNLTAIYRRAFDLPLLGRTEHKLIVGVSQLEENFEAWRVREFRAGTATRLNHYYAIAPDAFTGLPASFGELRRTPGQNEAEDNDFSLGFVAWSAEMLERRVILNAGVVRSLFTQSRQQDNAAGTANTGFVNSSRQNSPLVGAIVRPLPWLGLYAQASKSFNPNTSARDGFDNPLAPEQGKGTEFGAKLDPWEGRFTANFAVFRTIESNRLITDPNAPNSNSFYLDANGQPQPLSGPNDPRYNPNLPGQQRGARTAVGEATSDGFEAEIIWSPLKSLQILAGYTYLDGFVSRDLNTTPATWRGRPLPNNYYHRAVLLAKYTFDRGPLKGLDVVLGGNWRSEIFRGAINATVDSNTTLVSPVGRYGKPSLDGDFKLGYRTEIFDRRVSFQFNVKNLFGREVGVGWQPTTVRTYAYEQYYYTIPRSYTFSVSTEF